jgi:hypothetical protein
MTDYRIETLQSIFEEHSLLNEKNRKDSILRFKLNFPNDPLPVHYDDDFNISKAFSVMAKEINELKEMLKSHISESSRSF